MFRSTWSSSARCGDAACDARGRILRFRGVGGHAGFTLLELMLVLAIVVVLLGVVWPSVGSFLAEQPIKQSADMVRAGLAGGRHKAASTGMVYQFRYEPGGRKFIVVPFELDAEQIQTDGSGTSVTLNAGTVLSSDTLPVARGVLAPSCQFSTGAPSLANLANLEGPTTEQVPEQLIQLVLTDQDNPQDWTGVAWSAPVLFYPDGTSDDFTVSVSDTDLRRIDVQLRGLTAVPSVAPLVRDRQF